MTYFGFEIGLAQSHRRCWNSLQTVVQSQARPGLEALDTVVLRQLGDYDSGLPAVAPPIDKAQDIGKKLNVNWKSCLS
jgi:hypothetical protein